MAINSSVLLSHVTLPDGTALQAVEDVHKDYTYYSKTWHKRYGPKITVLARRVVSCDPTGHEVTLATYRRWPSMVKDVIGSGYYIATLRCVPETMLPIFVVDTNHLALSAAAKHLLSKG